MRSACITVERRWAIRIVITSRLLATSRIVRLISSSVRESSEEVASSKTSRCGRRSRARAMESRCFSPPETFTPPSPITVSRPLLGRGPAGCAGGAAQHLQALGVGGVRPHEEQVLADGAREELRVLGDEADALAQLVEVHPSCRLAVVEDAPAAGGRGPPAASPASSCPRPRGPRTPPSRRARSSNEMSLQRRRVAPSGAVKRHVLEGQRARARPAPRGRRAAAPRGVSRMCLEVLQARPRSPGRR